MHITSRPLNLQDTANAAFTDCMFCTTKGWGTVFFFLITQQKKAYSEMPCGVMHKLRLCFNGMMWYHQVHSLFFFLYVSDMCTWEVINIRKAEVFIQQQLQVEHCKRHSLTTWFSLSLCPLPRPLSPSLPLPVSLPSPSPLYVFSCCLSFSWNSFVFSSSSLSIFLTSVLLLRFVFFSWMFFVVSMLWNFVAHMHNLYCSLSH